MNQVVLVGRATAQGRLRYSEKGLAVTSFGLAVEKRKPAGSQESPGADFVEVVAFDRLAEVLGQHLAKGRLIAVKGRLSTRRYEHEGKSRKVVEVVAEAVRFLDAPKGNEEKTGG